MISFLLNTIALEPNRWTPEKKAYFKLISLLKPALETGFTSFELWQYHIARDSAIEIDQIKNYAEESGISFPIIGIYPQLHLYGTERIQELQEIRKMCAIADRLNTKVIKFFVGSISAAKITRDEYLKSISFMQEFAAIASGLGLQLAGEMHENTLFENPESCLKFRHDVESQNFKICYQPLNFSSTEQTIREYRRLAGDIIHIHLQGRKRNEITLLEESDIDYSEFSKVLKEEKFEGYLSLEFVKDCVVENPKDFDMPLVLSNAIKDRNFLLKLADEYNMEIA